MQLEDAVPIGSKYLSVGARLSPERFLSEKNAVIEWCRSNRERLDSSHETALADLTHFDLNSNSCAFIVIACYADIPAGRTYDAVFRFDDISVGSTTIAKLRFGLFWRRLPIHALEHGHHQVAVFDFPEGVPAIVTDVLPVDMVESPIGHTTLCLCDSTTWDYVRKYGRDA